MGIVPEKTVFVEHTAHFRWVWQAALRKLPGKEEGGGHKPSWGSDW